VTQKAASNVIYRTKDDAQCYAAHRAPSINPSGTVHSRI